MNARAMNSVFTTKRDLTPYKTLTPDVSLTEMNPPLKGLAGRQLWAARQSMGLNPRHVDDFPAQIMNRILWWDSKGYDTPYPGEKR